MGQAFRRAAGRLQNTNTNTNTPPPPSSSPPPRNPNSFEVKPAVLPGDSVNIHNKDPDGGFKSKGEERDPKFEAMLSQMVGRVTAKPGGKYEMGEAHVVQKPNRPLPKARDTTPGFGHYEERPVAAGTLNVAQLRHIMHLYQGKSNDHDGPMGLKEIAKKFRVDAVQLETIFRFVSLPPEDDTAKRRQEI